MLFWQQRGSVQLSFCDQHAGFGAEKKVSGGWMWSVRSQRASIVSTSLGCEPLMRLQEWAAGSSLKIPASKTPPSRTV